jgi:N-acetyl sugar amidotransferase
MNKKHQVCTKCVLDSSESTITFNENGECSFCIDIEQKTKVLNKPSVEAFNQIIAKVKKDGKNKEYDCIIGLSGGVDSSYVSYLVKENGLRPLAIHLDNGWNNELAVANIENICKKLDIDLYTHVIDWEEFRDLQKSFLAAGVANAEAPTDHAIFALLYNLACKFKVKYILDGVNNATEKSRPTFSGGGYIYSDLKQLNGIHKIFGTIPLKSFPQMSFYKKLFFQKALRIKQLSILNYVKYNKYDAIKLLQEELNWRDYGGKHHESIFTKWHQMVYLPKRFNFDKRKIHLSDLILEHQITREEAINELEKSQISIAELRELEEYVQKKLGYTLEEYNSLLNSPIKSYKDYPNDEWIINLYRKIINK